MIALLQLSSGLPGGAMAPFVCALFTLGLFVYIFQPARAEHGEEKSRLSFLYERREQTYENLRDLNFEYKAGKLSDADFHSMRDAMEQEAASILAEIEGLEQAAGIRREVNA